MATEQPDIYRGNAFEYHKQHFIPIPSTEGKRPKFEWKEIKSRFDYGILEKWEREFPKANIWIYLGPNKLVLDPDGEGAEAFVKKLELPKCPTAKSGRSSLHRYFNISRSLKPLKLEFPDESHLEVRTGDQGMLAPPSIHPDTGKPYQWMDGLSLKEFKELPEFPIEIYEMIKGLIESQKTIPPIKEEEPYNGPERNYNGHEGALDIAKYLSDHGIEFKIKREETRTLYCLKQCLFFENHTAKDQAGDSAIIQGIDGKITYYCFHSHCQNKTWHDTRNVISGEKSLIKYTGEIKMIEQEHLETPVIIVPKSNIVFPEESIQGVCREFANLYSANLESPFIFFVMAFLTILGCILSNRVTIESQIAYQPRLYTVILGESGDTRKSESIRQTINFFTNNLLTDGIGISYGVGSAEGLANKLNEVSRTLLVIDELKTFVGKSNIDGAILLPAVNSLFEDNKFHSQTKQHKIEINNAYLSFLTASTLETFERMFTPAFRDIGFLNRLFLVPGSSERKYPIPKQIPRYSQDVVAQHLRENINKIPESGVIKIPEKTLSIYQEWYLKQEGIYSTRLETYGARLMILFAVNEGKNTVDSEMMERIIKILDWQKIIREIHDPEDAENTVAKLENRIRKILLINGSCTKRVLQRKINASRAGLWSFNTAMKNLKEDGVIHEEARSGLISLLSG